MPWACGSCDFTYDQRKMPTFCEICIRRRNYRPRFRWVSRNKAYPRPKKRGKSRGAAVSHKRKRIYERDGFKCLRCGCDDIRELTLDHIVPKSKGGGNRDDNLQTLCETCNRDKGDGIMDYRESSYTSNGDIRVVRSEKTSEVTGPW